MKETDQHLVKYLILNAPNPEISDWIEDRVADYKNAVTCHACDCADVKITVDSSIQVKCCSCLKFTTGGITLDKIRPINYNAVSFLQEKKIVEILEAQGKI
jgi:hypothetical protein